MPEPITATTPRPLFMPDGQHWHDHGRAVYHLHRSGDVDLSTRVDVYSQLRHGGGTPMVTLQAQAGTAVFALRLLPVQARGLADQLRAAARPGNAMVPRRPVHQADEAGAIDLTSHVEVERAQTRAGAPLVGLLVLCGAAVCPLRTDAAEAVRLADMLQRAAATCVKVTEALVQLHGRGRAPAARRA